jgi:formylglycine-generating enzyme required for sulfatase activity
MAMDPTVLTVDQEKAMAAKPGSDFKECTSGCPVMIVIPAGKFIMGSPENEPDREASEGPQHEVTVAKPFAVSKFEVTFEEWDACVAAAACPRVTDHWGRGAMPVPVTFPPGWLRLATRLRSTGSAVNGGDDWNVDPPGRPGSVTPDSSRW